MKDRFIFFGLYLCCTMCFAQTPFQVEGNGLFTSPASTNVDIKNTDDNTNALVRFGDDNTSKSSVGFNGNDDVFKISMGSTLGRNDFTISEDGRIGVNSLPESHRLFILHNSTSGTLGSAHLTLQESGPTGFARLRFENAGLDAMWTIAGRTEDDEANLNFFYNNGTDFANVLSLDGDDFRVGILETEPEAYLHIKQNEIGVPALILENDNTTGGEKWAFVVAESDLELYFEGVLKGSFSSATGAYSAASSAVARASKDEELLGIDSKNLGDITREADTKNEKGSSVIEETSISSVIQDIQDQQQLIDEQAAQITQWTSALEELDSRLNLLEDRLTK